MSDEPVQNTDRELWRETDSYYAPSIHVTERGGIGINVGGNVYVKPLREWHELASSESPSTPQPQGDAEEPWRIALRDNKELRAEVAAQAERIKFLNELIDDTDGSPFGEIVKARQHIASLTQERDALRKAWLEDADPRELPELSGLPPLPTEQKPGD